MKKVIADTLSEFAKLKKSNLDELVNQQKQLSFESTRVERHENQIKGLKKELEA